MSSERVWRVRSRSYKGRELANSTRRKLLLESLEQRWLLAGDISPAAMEFIYELNVARNDPQAYETAAQLPAGMLNGVAPQQPLAVNDNLEDSALFHATEMADFNYFAHQSQVTGDQPNQMAFDAGYPLNSGFPLNQNYIESLAAGTFLTDPNDVLRLLIEDENVDPPGHRYHLLATGPSQSFWENHAEIGVGHAYNSGATYRNYWAIHTAYRDQTFTYLTGVVYDDANNNDSYDAGEGLSGVTVNVDGETVNTNDAGGWSLSVIPGEYNISASGGGFSGVSSTVATVSTSNVEVDFVSGEQDGYVNFVQTAGSPPVDPPPEDWVRTQRDLGAVDQGVGARDGATGTGFIMHSLQPVHERFADAPPTTGNSPHLVAVVHVNGQWHYDNDQTLTPFEPVSTDVLLASVDFDADTITSLVGQETVTEGIATGYGTGDLQFVANLWGGNSDPGEFQITGTSFDALSAVDRFELGVVNSGVAADDSATGLGYLLYSEQRLADRFSDVAFAAGSSEHVIAARFSAGQWTFDANGVHHEFEPRSSDILIAEIDYSADTVTSYEGYAGELNGVVAGFAAGDLEFFADQWGGAADDGEFQVTGTWFDVPSPVKTVFEAGVLGGGVQARDGATGSGFLMFSRETVTDRFLHLAPSGSSDHFVAVVFQNGQWHYDDNSVLIPFTPRASDLLVAEVDFGGDTVQPLTSFGERDGILSGFTGGDLAFQANSFGGAPNTGEFEVTGSTFERLLPTTLADYSVGELGGGLAANDNAQGDGFILYGAQRWDDRIPNLTGGASSHFAIVVFSQGQWQLDNNGQLVDFTPSSGDVIVAEVDLTADVVTPLEGTLGSRHGIEAGYLAGDLQFFANQFGGVANSGEFQVTGTHFTTTLELERIRVGSVNAGLAANDGATGPAFVLYSEQSLFDRFSGMVSTDNSEHLIVAFFSSNQWYVDANGAAIPFEPQQTDLILADIDYTNDTISGLAGVVATRHGIRAGYSESDLEFFANQFGGNVNSGEFQITGSHFDSIARETIPFTTEDFGPGVNARDNATGNGFLLHSRESLSQRFASNPPPPDASDHIIAVIYANGQWRYDNGGNLTPFTPQATDTLLAEVNFSSDSVTPLQNVFGEEHGIALGFSGGDLQFYADQYGGSANDGEFQVTGSHFERQAPTTLDSIEVDRPEALGAGVTARDNATGEGYLMYSQQPLGQRFGLSGGVSDHFVVVAFVNGHWHYDNDNRLVPFAPQGSDLLVAQIDFDEDTISDLSNVLGQVEGIDSGYLHGDLSFTANAFGGAANPGEFTVEGSQFDRQRPLVDVVRFGTGALGAGIAANDQATGEGHLMFSQLPLGERFETLLAGVSQHFIVVVYSQGVWRYDNNGQMTVFTPRADDLLVADINFDADVVTSLEGVVASRHGMQAGYIEGDLEFFANQFGGVPNAGEFEVTGSEFERVAPTHVVATNANTSNIAAHDSATGNAHILYSEEELFDRFAAAPPVAGSSEHFVVVFFSGGQWYYDNNGASHPFTPRATDVIVADVDYTNDAVQSREGQVDSVHGILAGYSDGDLTFLADSWNGSYNEGEFQVDGSFFRTVATEASGMVDIGAMGSGIAANDGGSGPGFLMYSEQPLLDRFGAFVAGGTEHVAAVFFANDQWHYDNNGQLIPFTPLSSDVLLAEFLYGTGQITSLEGALGEYEGIRHGYRSGDLNFFANQYGGVANTGEFEITGSSFTR